MMITQGAAMDMFNYQLRSGLMTCLVLPEIESRGEFYFVSVSRLSSAKVAPS